MGRRRRRTTTTTAEIDDEDNDENDYTMKSSWKLNKQTRRWKLTGAPCIGLALLLMASQFYHHPNPVTQTLRTKADFTKNLPRFSGSGPTPLLELGRYWQEMVILILRCFCRGISRNQRIPREDDHLLRPFEYGETSHQTKVWKNLKPHGQKLCSKLPLSWGNVQLTGTASCRDVPAKEPTGVPSILGVQKLNSEKFCMHRCEWCPKRKHAPTKGKKLKGISILKPTKAPLLWYFLPVTDMGMKLDPWLSGKPRSIPRNRQVAKETNSSCHLLNRFGIQVT